jgi:hypothetical protein
MHYTCAVPFDGNTAKAFDLAAVALTALGFRIVARDESTFDAAGPGLGSSRQSALLGASRIQVTRRSTELALEAELGGVQRLARFVTLFPLGLCLFLCVLFFVVFSLVLDNFRWVIPVVALTGGNALLWLFLGPLMSRQFRARTCQGIDALLNNMAVAGKGASV